MPRHSSGTVVIPKSVTPSRLEENFQDFILEEVDMEAINQLGKTKPHRYLRPHEWYVACFFWEVYSRVDTNGMPYDLGLAGEVQIYLERLQRNKLSNFKQ